MDQVIGQPPTAYRADRKGIQPRTVKGMTDEQWAVITGAADRDDMTVAAWIFRAAMAYLNGQPAQPIRHTSPLDIVADRQSAPPVLALPAPPQADRQTEVAAELKEAEYLEKLAALSAQAASLEKTAAATLNAIVRKKLKAYRAGLFRADRAD